MKKVTIKKYRTHRFLDYFGVVILSLLLLLVWQLYKGPIAVPYLKPYILQALNADDASYQVSVDSVNIELVRSIQPIKIIANNIVYKKKDDSFIVNAPRTSVSFSIRALLRGIVAPSSIEVENPSIYVFTSYGIKGENKNEVNKKKLEYYVKSFENFMERFNSEDKYYAESYINNISVKNASLEFHEVDLGSKWLLSDVNYNFHRGFSRLVTNAGALINLGDTMASVGFEGEYGILSDDLKLKASFSDIVPADFSANLSHAGSELYRVNLPLSGEINASVDMEEIRKNRTKLMTALDKAVKSIDFRLKGGSGGILFGDAGNEPYHISSFSLNGKLKSGLDKLDISNAAFDLDGLPATLGLRVSGFSKYFLENSLADLDVSVTADLPAVKFDELSRFWPRYIGEEAWLWCKDSLFVGEAQNASFTFNFAYDKAKKALAFKTMSGKADVADVTLNYLKQMPDVTNIYGQASFTQNSITVDLDKAVSDGIILTGGKVRLYDLDKNHSYADIRLIGESSVTDALRLIDNPPLNFVRDMKIPADRLSGNAEIDLSLNFELKDNLKPDEVKADVKAALSNVRFADVLQGRDLTSEALELLVTNDGLKLSGPAVMDDIPLHLVWDENFGSKVDKTRYDISFRLTEDIKKKLGVDFSLLDAPYVSGYADIQAQIIMSDDKKTTVDLQADLQHMALDYSFLGFQKLDGSEGRARVLLELSGDKLQSVPAFTLSKTDFNLDGKIAFDSSGALQMIDIYNINGPKTSAKAKIEWVKEKEKPLIKLNVSGMSYDLTEFFDRRNKKRDEELAADKAVVSSETDDFKNVPDADVNIAVNRLWTNPEVPITNFAGNAKLRNGTGVYEVHMVGNYGNSKQVRLKADYVPKPNNEFFLSIDSNNAGSTLKVLRLYENMHGGNLRIEARKTADDEIIGHASIRDFNLHNTPLLAKVLSMASLTGIVGMLSGEGLAFSHFDAPFEYKNSVLSVQEGKAFGNVLGITISGSYDRKTEKLNGEGLIAPAYSINSFIGKIPLIGSLLAGKDGTVFAANYSVSGSISDPKISINPLSALSPGSLKDLFSSMFGNSNDTQSKTY